MAVVVVESPAKAKTIKKYLGSDYEVLASKGHVKDLPKSGKAIDIENGFTEKFEVIEGKEKVLAELKAAAKNAEGGTTVLVSPSDYPALLAELTEQPDADDHRVRRGDGNLDADRIALHY